MNMHRIYRPFQTYFRTRRMRAFSEMFGVSARTRVIDVGGDDFNWTLIARPDVVIVNTDGRQAYGDGRALAFADDAFEVAYANSVIEHVGDATDRENFAAEIRRVAPRYYVQTPNRWFPVEPHLIAVGLHWLPRPIERRLVRWLSVWGWVDRPDQQQVDALLASIHLLDRAELQRLFPDADIVEERVFGLVKSLIAVRR